MDSLLTGEAKFRTLKKERAAERSAYVDEIFFIARSRHGQGRAFKMAPTITEQRNR